MKISFFLFFISAALACSSQSSVKGKTESNAPEEVLLKGTEDEMLTADFGSTEVKFRVERIEDNRCPRNAKCITGGAAKASISRKEAETTVLCLGTDCHELAAASEISVKGQSFSIELTEVNPYPEQGKSPENKVAIFKIRRVTR